MSLDHSKLENLKDAGGGKKTARCPACKEKKGDKKGEHLVIYPDDAFGCVAHPKNNQHTARIFKLAGVLNTKKKRSKSKTKAQANGKDQDKQEPEKKEIKKIRINRPVIPPSRLLATYQFTETKEGWILE